MDRLHRLESHERRASLDLKVVEDDAGKRRRSIAVPPRETLAALLPGLGGLLGLEGGVSRGGPDWNAVSRFLVTLGLDAPATGAWLRGLAPRVSALPSLMREHGVADLVVERCSPRIERVAQALARLEP